MERSWRMILSSLLLGFWFTLLFFGQQIGLSFVLFVVGSLVFLVYSLKAEGTLKKSKTWWLLVPILLLSLQYMFSRNTFFMPFNFLVISLLLVALSLTLVGKHLVLLLPSIFVPFKYFFKPYHFVYHKLLNRRTKALKHPYIKKIGLGLVICIPLLLVILQLLTSADMVFNTMLSKFPSLWNGLYTLLAENSLIAKLILTLITGTYFYCYIFHLFDPEVSLDLKENTIFVKEKFNFKFDGITVITILVVLNSVYALFSFIQFSYLFTGGLSLLPNHMTYSDYAHQGFTQLLLVTLINFGIVILSLVFTSRERSRMSHILNGLLVLTGFFNYVMIASSFYRMNLYTTVYGYTYLRVFVYFFLTLEAVLLLMTLIYIFYPKFNIILLAFGVSLTFYIGLNYMRIDQFIAKQNILLYVEKDVSLDFYYLESLSIDAAPDILAFYNEHPEMVTEFTPNYISRLETEVAKSQSWQCYNLSNIAASKALKSSHLITESKE